MSYVYDMDECKTFSMRSGWEEDVDDVSRSPERNEQRMQAEFKAVFVYIPVSVVQVLFSS